MSNAEIIIWSLVTGACLCSIIVMVLDVFVNSHWDYRSEGVSFQLAVLVWLLLVSGLLNELWPRSQFQWVYYGEVAATSMVAAVGSYRMRFWFGSRGRDRLLDRLLMANIVFALGSGLLVFWLPSFADHVVVGTVVALGTGLVLVWASRRAFWLHPAYSQAMIAAGVLYVVVAGLLFYNLRGQRLPVAVQFVLAVLFSMVVATISTLVWLRNAIRQHVVRRRRDMLNVDPVTGVLNGVSIVQRIDAFQRAHQAVPRASALVAVILQNTQDLQPTLGYIGTDVMYHQIATAIHQRMGGDIHSVGRYYDRCFLVLLEHMTDADLLRLRCLQLARELQQPMPVRTANGHQQVVVLAYGIGALTFDRKPFDTEVVIDLAQELATRAADMPTHCAMQSHQGFVLSPPVMLDRASYGGSLTSGLESL